MQKPAQVQMSNLTGGLFKALAHFHLGAHLVGQFYGQMKCLRLALPQNRQEKLAMELLAVGASAVGLAALAAAFDERAGKHLAPRAQSANQPAAQGEIGVVWASDTHNSVRIGRSQAPSRICKNDGKTQQAITSSGSMHWTCVRSGVTKSLSTHAAARSTPWRFTRGGKTFSA